MPNNNNNTVCSIIIKPINAQPTALAESEILKEIKNILDETNLTQKQKEQINETIKSFKEKSKISFNDVLRDTDKSSKNQILNLLYQEKFKAAPRFGGGGGDDDNHVPFNQVDLIKLINDEHKNLQKLMKKYNGLCDILCNYVMKNNLLENRDAFDHKNNNLLNNEAEALKELNGYYLSHIFNIINFLEKLIYIFSEKHRYSPFANKADQQNIKKYLQKDNINKNNFVITNNIPPSKEEIKSLNTLEKGKYYKICIFCRTNLFSFTGHSLLIKKTADNQFNYFDPNIGAYFDQSAENVLNLVKKSNDILFNFGFSSLEVFDIEKLNKNFKAPSSGNSP